MGATRARIATVCQAGQFKPTIEGNREHVLGLLDVALRQRPDLVCLPEAFLDVGVGGAPGETAEPLDGPTIQAFARKARQAGCYVVCPLHTRDQNHGSVHNSAVLLDRRGQVAGLYHKRCPVTSAADYTRFEGGVTPGGAETAAPPPVFDLDFGRVGIQICFDIGFPENWRALAERGTRLVLWPSAYEGGFPLRVYAYQHHYWVVSSTRTGRSRVVDPCGQILGETGDAAAAPPVLVRDINLDYVVAHLDWNMAIPDRIRARYGERVEVRQWDPGSAHFVVEPRDPSLTCARLQEEFGFESTAQYHERHRRAYQQIGRGEPAPPQEARHGDRPQWGK
jgi:predicted amidohydrolase